MRRLRSPLLLLVGFALCAALGTDAEAQRRPGGTARSAAAQRIVRAGKAVTRTQLRQRARMAPTARGLRTEKPKVEIRRSRVQVQRAISRRELGMRTSEVERALRLQTLRGPDRRRAPARFQWEAGRRPARATGRATRFRWDGAGRASRRGRSAPRVIRFR